jgi:copper(I)-binding protein
MRALIPLLFLIATASCNAPSNSQAPALAIEQAWAAPTPAGVDVSAGYLSIVNGTAAEDRLLGATSPRAERIELHEMSIDGAVMRMRGVDTLTIAPGEHVELGPGGMHLMFYGVTEPFTEGQDIPVQLTFETAGPVNVTLPVRRAAPESRAAH